MGRRRTEQEAVSLFPFLSILACVIGVLTLLISALAISQVDPQAVADLEERLAKRQEELARQRAEALERLEQAEQLERSTERLERSAELHERGLRAAQNVLKQLDRARRELREIEAKQEESIAGQERDNKLLAEANRLRDRIKELEEELAELLANVKALQEELAKLDRPTEEATTRIRPGGSGTNLKPTFVECRAGEIVVYHGDEPLRVRSGDISSSEPLAQVFEKVKQQRGGSIVFLVRGDAVGTYSRAQSTASEQLVPNGKLPVLGQGRIDLSLFDPS